MRSARASFTVEIECACPPEQSIRLILDLRRHSQIIPLTRVSPAVDVDGLVVGEHFVARTGVGPLAFNDVMRVEELSLGVAGSAASAQLSKHGRAIRGGIWLLVTPTPGGSLVQWHQEVLLPWLPGFMQGLAARVLKLGYRAVLSRLLAVEVR